MTIDMSRFYQVFFDETGEHLAEMESLLLELDVDRPDLEMLNAIFRAAHSIKGGAGTFGFADMARVTHVLETLLDRLRSGELQPTVAMVDAFLEANDVLANQLAAHQAGNEYQDERIGRVCERLEALSQTETDASPEPSPTDDRLPVDTAWCIEFDSEAAGLRSESGSVRDALDRLVEVLADTGTLERVSEVEGQPVSWRLTTDADRSDILELFAFVCDRPDAIEVTGTIVTDEDPGYGFFADAPGVDRALDQEYPGYGLFGGSPGMGEVAAVATRSRLDNEQGYGFFDPSPGWPARPESSRAAVGTGGRLGPGVPPLRRPAAGESSIRISVEKVDQLINLVGELVITHAMLAESASGLDSVHHEKLFDGLSNLERNSRDLQQAVMSIRMMPISFVFNRFPRVVRDTAAALHKKVQLRLVGEDTELDKSLIERLADPLNHLVRNSIDHGIESPEVRRAAGKAETGQIVLRASHQGGSIVVEVSDDGAGLDRAKLLAKAADQGIVLPENPSDKEVWQLIFAAGFSTADAVTDISGRGVGMDVVRRNIEQMNGRVEIDSAPGEGTRVIIRLPLTLAILDGLSLRLGGELFILPLTVIRECIRPRREQLKRVAGKGRVLQVNGEYLPLVILHEVFDLGQERRADEDGIVVIVDTNEGRTALLVDDLVSQHQVVIKSLETNYRKVEGVSGATIMGDGRVALILDVDELVRLSHGAAGPQISVETGEELS